MKKIRYILVGISGLLIILGLFLGQHQTVLQKAIKICLECIGVG